MAVEDLFFNIPARLKFLKIARTELGHIRDTMERLAMAHPAVGFQKSEASTASSNIYLTCLESIDVAILRHLLLGVNLSILFVPLIAVFLLPLADAYLTRQTERSLISQSVLIGEAWRDHWLAAKGLSPAVAQT